MNEIEIIGVLVYEMLYVVNGDMLIFFILEGFVFVFGVIVILFFLMGENNNRGRRVVLSMVIYYMVRNVVNIFGKIVLSVYLRRREYGVDKLVVEIIDFSYMKSVLFCL